MQRRKSLRFLAFGLLLCVGSSLARAQSKVHRVLFAVTSADEADWRLTMGNIRNLIAGMAPEAVEVEVVAYGPGLALVRKPSSVDAEIQALQTKHVRFVACENSMHMQHVTAADLVDGVGSVPSGIIEVVKKQEQGWSYIKAGR